MMYVTVCSFLFTLLGFIRIPQSLLKTVLENSQPLSLQTLSLPNFVPSLLLELELNESQILFNPLNLFHILILVLWVLLSH